MTELINETWVTETNERGPYGPYLSLAVLGEDGLKRPWMGDERIKLAKCAPEMARLLLRLQRGVPIPGECPCCENDIQGGQEHDADCDLARVLRDAGVMP